MLQAKLKQFRDLEAAKHDAAEEAKAAERFKDVKGDLSDWEAKYGHGAGASAGLSTPGTTVHQLGFDQGSSASLLDRPSPQVDHLPLVELGERSLTPAPMEMLSTEPSDPELERKIQLLAEVQRIRRDVRGSIDQLRDGTPEPQSRSRRVSISSGRLLDTSGSGGASTPMGSPTLARSDWDSYLRERKLVTPPSGITPPIPTTATAAAMQGSRRSEYVVVSQGVARALDRMQRTMSSFELGDPSAPDEWGWEGPSL